MNIFDFTLPRLEQYFAEKGENPAKAAIVFDGVYRRNISSFAQLGFSPRVTKQLESDFSMQLPETAECLEGGDAAKLLLRLADGEYVETVLMRQKFGCCVCVSTQVGCSMGCSFCQSGLLKKKRSLSAGEIIGQVMCISRHFGVKISGISVMGIGEPFDNFDSVADFCSIASAPKGLGIGEKHITVSTCGLVPEIYRYAALPHPCNLAISLHAPNDELRSRLMPVNRAYPIGELLSAAEHFSQKANRRVTLEYVMLENVNDLPEHAQQLADIIGSRSFYVNIIPYNSTDSVFRKSSRERIMAFYDVLKKNKIGVTMRREFGAELKAACGQLSADYAGKR